MKKFHSIGWLLLTVLCTTNPIHAMEKEDTALRLMSYNIRRKGKETEEQRQWDKRLPLVKALIERTKPDLIGLQEATQSQIDDLNQELPQYDSFGEGRGESWWGWGTDEHTPIFYDKGRVEELESGTFSISDPESALGWMPWHARKTGWLNRICTWGKFKDKTTGKEFYLYNTHLDHMYPQARISGLEQIKKKLPKGSSDPLILMGDFNTELTPEIKAILTGFENVKDRANKTEGPQETRTGWDDEELKTIDHILMKNREGAVVELYKLIAKEEGKPYPSDHRPVLAEILLKN